MKHIFFILLVTIIFTGCEKVLNLQYKDNQSKLVIEGNITNQIGPYFVKITRSIRLPETGAYPTVNNANVTISDDAGNNETLVLQGNGIYQTTTLTGVEGRTYTLTVNVDNQTYTAKSTMPKRVPFDSVKVENITFIGSEIEYNIIPVYKDPFTKGDNYRFVLFVNDSLINQHFVQNDEVKNGVVNTVRLEVDDDDLILKKGDLISLNMQCIDKNVALFYTTLALISNAGPGGGTTPNNPPNNLTNGALGLFSAHTVEKKSVRLR